MSRRRRRPASPGLEWEDTDDDPEVGRSNEEPAAARGPGSFETPWAGGGTAIPALRSTSAGSPGTSLGTTVVAARPASTTAAAKSGASDSSNQDAAAAAEAAVAEAAVAPVPEASGAERTPLGEGASDEGQPNRPSTIRMDGLASAATGSSVRPLSPAATVMAVAAAATGAPAASAPAASAAITLASPRQSRSLVRVVPTPRGNPGTAVAPAVGDTAPHGFGSPQATESRDEDLETGHAGVDGSSNGASAAVAPAAANSRSGVPPANTPAASAMLAVHADAAALDSIVSGSNAGGSVAGGSATGSASGSAAGGSRSSGNDTVAIGSAVSGSNGASAGHSYGAGTSGGAGNAGDINVRMTLDRASVLGNRALRVLSDFLSEVPSETLGGGAGGTGEETQLQVHYPRGFKTLVGLVVALGFAWVVSYFVIVLPAIQQHGNTPCKYNDSQLTYNAKMLSIYFAWFAMTRTSLLTPCVASRLVIMQSRSTQGFCRMYCINLLLRDGPLYIFVAGSVLFWFHILHSPSCATQSPKLYRTLKGYAIYNCIVSLFSLILAYWHNRLLMDAARDQVEVEEAERSAAPPGTIDRLETQPYDEALFGDEDDKLYSAECAICLGAWEPDDVIKATPCRHAFHEECLGSWLRTARTCALCRQDLTKLLLTQQQRNNQANADVIGLTTAGRAAETGSRSDTDSGSGAALGPPSVIEEQGGGGLGFGLGIGRGIGSGSAQGLTHGGARGVQGAQGGAGGSMLVAPIA